MVLESTIVCVDNSEFSRNGDFAPTRFVRLVFPSAASRGVCCAGWAAEPDRLECDRGIHLLVRVSSVVPYQQEYGFADALLRLPVVCLYISYSSCLGNVRQRKSILSTFSALQKYSRTLRVL